MNENFTAHMEDNLDRVEEGKVKWQETLKEFFPDFKDQIDKATTVIKKHVEFSEKICPKCGGKMVIKWSRKGRFLSCEHFPKCKYAESITTDVNCPDCKDGKLIERRNKRGQFFYGCSNFPKCRFTSRSLPKQTDESDEKESGQDKIEK
jgi:DNA topoisomerase-1